MGSVRPPIHELRTALECATPALRPAVLEAHRGLLAQDRSSDGAQLLADLASGVFDGVDHRSFRAAVACTAPSQAARALELLEEPWPFDARHLVATLSRHDALEYVADIRDGRRNGNNFLFTTGVVHLAVTVASGALREFKEPLHRSDGNETAFLLGAARHPRLVLAEMRKVGYHPGPTPVHDAPLVEWVLAAPGLDAEVRAYVVSLLAAECVAALAHSGALTATEVVEWIRARLVPVIDVQIHAALCLAPSTPGVRRLQRLILRLAPSAAALLAPFSTEQRRTLLGVLHADPARSDQVDMFTADLARSVHRPPQELADIARRITRRIR